MGPGSRNPQNPQTDPSEIEEDEEGSELKVSELFMKNKQFRDLEFVRSWTLFHKGCNKGPKILTFGPQIWDPKKGLKKGSFLETSNLGIWRPKIIL